MTDNYIEPHDMTSNSSHSPFVVSASSNTGGWDPWRAFDGAWNDGWLGTGAGVDWLKLDTGGSYICIGYRVIQADTAGRAPKNWTFQGSNDNSTWTTLDTRTNQTSWGNNEGRTFLFTNSTAYRYYRINISANNGDGTYVGFAELYLYTAYPGPTSYLGKLPPRANWKIIYVAGLRLSSGGGVPITPVPVAVVLHDGVQGVAYSETISAQGGTGPYVFSLSSGSLPTSTSLNSSTGVISGTPSVAGIFSFTIGVVDAHGNIGSQNFQITISAPPATGGGSATWMS